jgi:hypothetical protein
MGTRPDCWHAGDRGGFVVGGCVVWPVCAVQGLDLPGERADGLGVDGCPQGDVVSGAVVAELKVEGVVQFAPVCVRQERRVEGPARTRSWCRSRTRRPRVDRLADHRDEPPVRAPRLGQQVGDAAIAIASPASVWSPVLVPGFFGG